MGVPGSGTFVVADRLLGMNGVTSVERVEAGATDTEAMLLAGAVDAGFIVAAADAPVIASLAASTGLAVYTYSRAEACAPAAVPVGRTHRAGGPGPVAGPAGGGR